MLDLAIVVLQAARGAAEGAIVERRDGQREARALLGVRGVVGQRLDVVLDRSPPFVPSAVSTAAGAWSRASRIDGDWSVVRHAAPTLTLTREP